MTSALINVDVAAMAVTDFLPAADLFSLHAVNRDWHNFLDEHEEKIFHEYLYRDFVEGTLLRHAIADKYDISKKKLYKAFAMRWIMPRAEGREEQLRIPWIRPERKKKGVEEDKSRPAIPMAGESSSESSAGDSSIESREGDSSSESSGDESSGDESNVGNDVGGEDCGLVFIGRVGGIDSHLSCVALKMKATGRRSKLVLDKEAMHHIPSVAGKCEAERKVPPLILPQDEWTCELLENPESSGDWRDWSQYFYEATAGTFDATLHVIDVRSCQVLTVPFECVGTYDGQPDDAAVQLGYRWHNIYGIPPEFSPRYRDFTKGDFQMFDGGGDRWMEGFPAIDGTTLFCNLSMKCITSEDGETAEISACADGLEFDFGGDVSNIEEPQDMLCFFRAMMKEKCAKGELETIRSTRVQQPAWIQFDAVVDAMTKYASFEDQAGKLRLVCRQFQSSALRQLEQKVEKLKVIGGFVDLEFRTGSFKAVIRRGWSDDILTSRARVVTDALALASCRCLYTRCEGKERCPTASEPPTYNDDKEQPQTLDMEWARKTLHEKGRIQLTRMINEGYDNCVPTNQIECSYKEKEMGIYQLCDEIEMIIRRNAQYEGLNGEATPIDERLQKAYKVSAPITTKQFVRSIFLLFARAESEALDSESEEGCASKKARLASFDEVRVGFAKTTITGPDGSRSRMKQIYRFYAADRERIEICFQSRDGCSRYE